MVLTVDDDNATVSGWSGFVNDDVVEILSVVVTTEFE